MLRYKTETTPGLVALYDIRPGNGAGPFLQPRSPHGACFILNKQEMNPGLLVWHAHTGRRKVTKSGRSWGQKFSNGLQFPLTPCRCEGVAKISAETVVPCEPRQWIRDGLLRYISLQYVSNCVWPKLFLCPRKLQTYTWAWSSLHNEGMHGVARPNT